jgi:A/G-specific adenine glycosylase
VFSRLTGGTIRGDRTGKDEAACWELATVLVEGDLPGELNQSLMELGATVCTSSRPDCLACPVSRWCEGFAAGDPERFPLSRPKQAASKVLAAVAVIRRSDRVLLEKPGEWSPLRGNWDLPAVETGPGGDGAETLLAGLHRRYGLEAGRHRSAGTVSHGIMNRRISLSIHLCSLRRGRVAGREPIRWVREDRLDETPVSGATLKVLRAVRT